MKPYALRSVLSCALTLAVLATYARASTIWDESVNGDLSGDRLNPTPLSLAPGTNSLIATSSSGDREYVHFTLPAGTVLSAINNISWVSTDSTGFIGVQNGSIFTEPPTGTNVANLLGWTHFGTGPGTIGSDILPQMGVGAGAIGFTPPLAGPDLTFWIQQTSTNLATYQLDFVVSVPAPASAGVLLCGIGIIGRRRR